MNISRITKALADIRSERKFADAEVSRNVDIDLIFPNRSSESVCLMGRTAVALALRCFSGEIRIHAGPTTEPALKAALESEAQKLDATQRLVFGSETIGPWQLAIACLLEGAVCADASGWTARINGTFENRLPAATSAATFAVACAFAKLFNKALLHAESNITEKWDFCLIRFAQTTDSPAPIHEKVDLGKVGLLGAGAIGSAVGYILRESNWGGKLHIIDYQHFELPNLETCITADLQAVNHPLRKAAALAQQFQNHNVVAVERQEKVKAGSPLLNEKWDAFICAVDNSETRRILDFVNSPVLSNAGLGSTKHDPAWVFLTRHGKGDVPLSEVYRVQTENVPADMSEVPEEFREECSRMQYQGVALSLPFVALAAGSLLVASLYQNLSGMRKSWKSLRIDLFNKQQKYTAERDS